MPSLRDRCASTLHWEQTVRAPWALRSNRLADKAGDTSRIEKPKFRSLSTTDTITYVIILVNITTAAGYFW